MNSKETGRKAEQKIAAYLQANGYDVLDLNWRRPYAEIDIVAKKAETIYFVEVKYRSSNIAGDGFDYITTQKLKHMQRAAESWVLENNYEGPYELLAAAVDDEHIDVRQI